MTVPFPIVECQIESMERLPDKTESTCRLQRPSWMAEEPSPFGSHSGQGDLCNESRPEGRFLGYDRRRPTSVLAGRAVLWAFLLLWGLKMITGPLEEGWNTFLHYVNLPIHETAHLVFLPFGTFMHFLGGTLGQILFPLVLAVFFLVKNRDAFASALCLWWTGQNFLDIAPYIDDARTQTAALVGGGVHDWGWLLGHMRMLHLDHAIARTVFVIGGIIMVTAMVWAGLVLVIQFGYMINARPKSNA